VRAKKIMATAGATVLGVVAFAVVSSRDTVQAHGGMTFPSTRTHACYVNGRAGGNGGDLDPTNPACRDAIAAGGKDALWNWFGNLLPDAGDRHRQVVPDGKLCGPGATFDAYNMARADWPTTNLQPGAMVTFRYNAWAPHPGTWYQYVTRDGFDVTAGPLRWSDLEPVPFNQVTNPPINGSGPEGAEYTWPVRLPNKTGRHIIYSIWERSDSPEAFYNCSDVNFGGTSSPTTPTTASPAPTTPTTGTPPTTARPTTTAPVPTTAPSTTAPPMTTTVPAPTTTSPAPIPGGCAATSRLESSWPGGFQATVTVRNTGTSSLSGWRVGLGHPSGVSITQGWSGTFDGMTVTHAPWNGAIAPGQSVTFGYLGQGSASPAPTVTGCTAA
jgi:predicted carbohydrate-binding protein with CBM5 and CBM33 domain